VNKKYIGRVKNRYVIGEKWIDLIESLVWCPDRWTEKARINCVYYKYVNNKDN
jgi:hypothetical protein